MPWRRLLEGGEDGLDLGFDGWRVGVDDSVDLDRGRAQGFQGAQESAQGQAGAVLDGARERESGEDDG